MIGRWGPPNGAVPDLDGASDHLLRDIGLEPAGVGPEGPGFGLLAGVCRPRRRYLLPANIPSGLPRRRITMTEAELLSIARETIAKVPHCMAITVGKDGTANARVVQPHAPDEDWTVTFLTSRTSRKAAEIEATSRLTLAYQYDPEGAYVTLVGSARLDPGPEAKAALWQDTLGRWFPRGPRDPDAVVVRLSTRRVELWSYLRGIMPEPRGLRAAVVERAPTGWTVLAP